MIGKIKINLAEILIAVISIVVMIILGNKITSLTKERNSIQADLDTVRISNSELSDTLKQTEHQLEQIQIKLEVAENELKCVEEELTDQISQNTAISAHCAVLEEENAYLKDKTNYVFNGKWNYDYTEEDVEILAGVIYGENYISGRWEMMLTGSVVLNRVLSPRFPNTVKEVVYQIDSGYEQYAPRTKRLIGSDEITWECYDLAKLLLEYGPVAPEFLLYQAHRNQGQIYWEWEGEQFCYKSKEDR